MTVVRIRAMIQAKALLAAARQLLALDHAASLTESPGRDHPPVGINPAAQDVWSDVLRRYSDVIFKGRSIGAEWGTAIQVFERACRARGIRPYLGR